jgi:hypothetical protein
VTNYRSRMSWRNVRISRMVLSYLVFWSHQIFWVFWIIPIYWQRVECMCQKIFDIKILRFFHLFYFLCHIFDNIINAKINIFSNYLTLHFEWEPVWSQYQLIIFRIIIFIIVYINNYFDFNMQLLVWQVWYVWILFSIFFYFVRLLNRIMRV